MTKAFDVVGVSTLNGKTKLRFANGIARRQAVLARNGHDNIRLIQLAEGQPKEVAALALAAHADFQDEATQAVIKAWFAKRD
jgi:hypothetical protein